jgi:hypothetical protein
MRPILQRPRTDILTMSPHRSLWTVCIMDKVQGKGPEIGQSRLISGFREFPKAGKGCVVRLS